MGVAQKEEAGLLLLPSLPKEGVLMEERWRRGGGAHTSLGTKRERKTATITSKHDDDPFGAYNWQLEIAGISFKG